eukprot:5320224-Pyramimonas_sp.AAC.1
MTPASRPSLVTRAPFQRSLLGDAPRGIQSRNEVMRRRVENVDGNTGRVSESVSEPAPESMDLLARREASFAVEPHESLVGFFNERT